MKVTFVTIKLHHAECTIISGAKSMHIKSGPAEEKSDFTVNDKSNINMLTSRYIAKVGNR